MDDENLEKIIKFFKKIECPAEFVLKKNLDNALSKEYTVVYGGEDIMFSDKKNKKFEFEEKIDLDISAYFIKYFNKERLLKRLEQECYFICDLKT